MAKSKLRIQDEPALRQELETLILSSSQALLVEWSIETARRNLKEAQLSELETKTIDSAFQVALAKMKGEGRAYDVRVAGFAVHQLVDSVQDPIKISVLRVCGQAVGVAHMREHAQVMADYAIKAINQKHPGDLEAVAKERRMQIDSLQTFIRNQKEIAD
ncbi:MAG: hypothetical protein A2Y20_06590 [Firmicutes bacterium GWF2_51_9]|nr:MAG: hypothetical protein A2Y20_06590 [Firmicutes bacterium GWF2_51_9]OGS59318.1 MAG: hypothetical protein A2Y19_08965 [Firmicutes bacterium GWE2_51_13]HBZ40903.1 hypothetical protein [Erysipelotrichaceae bacterium]